MAPKSDSSTEDTGHSPCIIRCVRPFDHPGRYWGACLTRDDIQCWLLCGEPSNLCVDLRLGFERLTSRLMHYADSKHAKDHAVLPLPIDPDHKFAPVSTQVSRSRTMTDLNTTRCRSLLATSRFSSPRSLFRGASTASPTTFAANCLFSPVSLGSPRRDSFAQAWMLPTGKIMCAGPELAEAASKGLSSKMSFKSISE